MERPAGFWIRLIANILDGFITAIVFLVIGLLVHGEINNEEFNITDLLNLLYYILLPVLWSGYTIGKRAFNVRIVKKNGSNVGFFNMVMRYFVAGIVYVLTLGIGLIVSAFMVGLREDKRSLHDFIGGTKVVYKQSSSSI
ncbi:RDD family protein [Halobacillus fulvus]|nr:RDD family protein [Halobacillus fulvus]